jgi:hypothetical protein
MPGFVVHYKPGELERFGPLVPLDVCVPIPGQPQSMTRLTALIDTGAEINFIRDGKPMQLGLPLTNNKVPVLGITSAAASLHEEYGARVILPDGIDFVTTLVQVPLLAGYCDIVLGRSELASMLFSYLGYANIVSVNR